MSAALVAGQVAQTLGPYGITFLVLFVVAAVIVIALGITVAVYGANQINHSYELSAGTYYLRTLDGLTIGFGCNSCFTSPADCVSLGIGIGTSTDTITLSDSATIIPTVTISIDS